MARISDMELQRLKKDISLVRLAEAKGVALKKSGDNLLGRCPFHEDKTPSFVVSESKNVWHCLGACRAGGSVIDFVMKAEGVSFRHAVELLRNDTPLAPLPAGSATVSRMRRLPALVTSEVEDAKALSDVADYYHRTLLNSPEALDYLAKRGLKDEALIRHFRLGYANRTLGLRLPSADRKEGVAVREKLQRLGVLRESGHEHLSGSLVVPLLDEAGAVVGMYGRKLLSNLRAGTPAHVYLPGPHRAAFNSLALAGQPAAIICEAVLDALSFWTAGFHAVTAAYGVDGFTPHHLAALKHHGVRQAFLAYDRDDAGDGAAVALAKRLEAEGIECWRVLFPRGMDANEYVCKLQPATKSLGLVLRQAQPMGPDGKARPPPPMLPEASSPASPLAAQPAAALPAAAGRRDVPSRGQVAARTAVASATAVPGALKGERVELPAPRVVSVAVPVPAVVAVLEPKASLPTTAPAPATAEAPTISAPPAPTTTAAITTTAPTDDEAVYQFGARRYRVRGLARPQGTDALRVNVLLGHGEAFHVDTFDVYSAKARAAFVATAATECGVDADAVKHDVGRLLLEVEALMDARRLAAQGPKVPTLTEAERDAALDFLRTPDLLGRVLADFGRCGVVGEETNKLVGYLAAVSRKLEEPLAVLIQSSSAAGKSSLMEAVLAFVPPEEKVKYSAMTGQSLFYMGDADLKHKVLAIVEEEGASRASYALKLLQSEGELTIASTGKDPHTGRLVTHEYRVEGPTQLFLTTTATELDDELLNRCLVLTVDEDRAQTSAIHKLQREKRTLEGRLAKKQRDGVLKLHQDAQRLLRPLAVVNPFAPALTFPDDRTRMRRDFPKYLTLIDAVALLHQYQRPVKTVTRGPHVVEYIEVTLADVEAANRLAAHALGRTLDELPPQTRKALAQLEAWVARRAATEKRLRSEVAFTRREAREALGLRNSQLALHLSRLVDFEYLEVRRGARGLFAYALSSPDGGAPGLAGLADAAALQQPSTTPPAFQFPGEEISFRGASGVGAGRWKPNEAAALGPQIPVSGANANAHGGSATSSSYVEVRR